MQGWSWEGASERSMQLECFACSGRVQPPGCEDVRKYIYCSLISKFTTFSPSTVPSGIFVPNSRNLGAIHCATSGSVLPARARFVACGMPDDMRLSESLFVNSSYASLQ